jgi:hypothetical protein
MSPVTSAKISLWLFWPVACSFLAAIVVVVVAGSLRGISTTVRLGSQSALIVGANWGRIDPMVVKLSGDGELGNVSTDMIWNRVQVNVGDGSGGSMIRPFGGAMSPVRLPLLGFYSEIDEAGPFTFRYIQIPYWAAFAGALLLPTWGVFRFIFRRHRELQSLCMRCGYDLRASPDRCPECGYKRGRDNVSSHQPSQM